jgi:hypothetical protein
MSIKLIARELYRLQCEVERLEAELETAAADRRPELEVRLRRARREKAYVRGAMDGRIGRASS